MVDLLGGFHMPIMIDMPPGLSKFDLYETATTGVARGS